jgi:hypothetical protein
MTEHQASRTLVKSPPELWAECSDPGSLGRHLNDCFGEIKITRLEPETAVAWEGERGSGTVRLEPSGWGTRVILTARAEVDAVNRPVAPATQQPPAPGGGASTAPAPQGAIVPTGPAPAASATRDPSQGDWPRAALAEPPPPAAAPPPPPMPPPAPPRRGLLGRLFARNQPVAEPRPAAPPAAETTRPEPARARQTASAPPAAETTRPEPARARQTASPPPAAEPPANPTPTPPTAEAPAPPPTPAPPRHSPTAIGPAPPPTPQAPQDPAAALARALDSLGQAHHRPFSRA